MGRKVGLLVWVLGNGFRSWVVGIEVEIEVVILGLVVFLTDRMLSDRGFRSWVVGFWVIILVVFIIILITFISNLHIVILVGI